ncbi:MAG: GNAT family N-acetyltransferase [Clostridia bacterium]|nr:GNAT family N-acetyltransferase [Clostridia bacterium]
MIHVHHIEKEELPVIARIKAVAFNGSFQENTTAESLAAPEAASRKLPCGCGILAATNDSGVTVSTMECIPYSLRIMGKSAPACGIGGVATLPEYRNLGAVREMFRFALAEMKEKGEIFSLLNPFSRAYYRKFGYEDVSQIRRWRIPLASLPKYELGGCVRELIGQDNVAPLVEIDRRMLTHYDLSVDRCAEDYISSRRANPCASNFHTYVWSDDEGRDRAYITFNGREDSGERVLWACGAMANNGVGFTDPDGLRAILSFLRVFASQFKSVIMPLPENVTLLGVLPEMSEVRQTARFATSLRIVDLPAAMAYLRPRAAGELKLSVSDALCPWNEGCWHIVFDDERVLSCCRCEEEPDVTMPISALIPLYAGSRGGDELCWLDGVRVINPDAPFDSLFYRKPIYLVENF